MPRPRKSPVRLERHNGRREYRAHIYDANGNLRRYWLGTADKIKAESMAAQLKQKLSQAIPNASMTIASMYEKFVSDNVPHWSPLTKQAYEYYLPRFLDYLNAISALRMDDLHNADTRGFTAWLQREYGHFSDATINSHIRSASVFLNYFDLNNVSKNLKRIRKPKVREKTTVTPQDAAKILEAMSSTIRKMFIAYMYTGCRKQELINLKWQDVDFKRKTLTVTSKGKTRIIPMLPQVEEVLGDIKPRRTYVFTSSRKKKYNTKSVLNALWKACDKAKVKRVSVQALRRTVATHLKESGVSDKIIQELLGHVSLDTSYEHYINVSERLKAESLSRIGGIIQQE